MRVFALLLSAGLVLGGCATLFSGTEEPIYFDSNPSGARILIDGLVVGTTPATIEVDRPGLEDTDVTVQLPGSEPIRFELDKKFNNTAILNILFWPGFLIDALTGALYRYDKTEYTAHFDDGAVSLRLEELPRSETGSYLLPGSPESLAVTDSASGVTLVFR